MKKIVLVFGFVLHYVANCIAQNYTLAWSDSFSSNVINTNNWQFESGTGSSGWGNNELQYYTNRAENATIINGQLAIIAKQEMYQGSDYTSARLLTKTLKEFKYGKIEARIKLPQTKGVWPAFWMLGANIDAVSWPSCGEIDILEHINTESIIHGTLHWNNNGHVQSSKSVACNVSNYHVYGIEWTTDSIKWFLDNNVYHKYSIKNNANNTGAFHQPFFLLLNMAVGGNWPGSPNASSVFPDTMLVDYVNVFQKFALDINEKNIANTINIFPNPVQDELRLEVNHQIDEEMTISIYNAMGVQMKQSVLPKNIFLHTINVNNLPTGNYYYRMQCNSRGIRKGSFVKE
jgi:beta-glucanase (GH16 family)